MTTVLVTGGNSGIGAATVAALLERGARVVATVRSSDSADEVRRAHPGASLTVEILDVTDAEVGRAVIDHHRPDVLVNNAGDALLGALVDCEDDEVREQLEVMLVGPNRLARYSAEHQRARGAGRIVNVSSTLARAPLPFTGWYSAAKAALEVTTDILRQELRPAGIDVVLVECGPVSTHAWQSAGEHVTAGSDPTTRSARQRWHRLTTIAEPAFADPAKVGARIAEAALAEHPRTVYRVGPGSRLEVLTALLPARLTDLVSTAVFGLRTRPGT